ncbi:hypothetical protein [Paracoccus sp. NBH48]|nr:hypothetical protein [Paracoccus sp. NBH48]
MTDSRPIPAPQDMQDRIRAILAGPMACPRMGGLWSRRASWP